MGFVPFRDVLDHLRQHDWQLTRIWQPYRVFTKPDRLPILVRVVDRKVDADDFAKIKAIVAQDEAAG